MGSILAETPFTTRIHGLITPLKDLFAAVFLGAYISGKSAFDAADLASRFIYVSIRDTASDTSPNAGVEYEKNLKMLTL